MMKLSQRVSHIEFPWKTLALSLFFILCTPFLNGWLVLVPIAIQLYRIGHYDEHIFMVDVSFLLPFSAIFMIPNVGTALGTLIVLANVYYAIKKWAFPVQDSMLCLVFLSVYLLLRMQREWTTFVFIISGLVFMYLMLECAEAVDAICVAKGFVAGLMIASVYGMAFRGKAQLVHYISREVAVSMEYQNLRRFSGLMADPNYYSVFLILGMALLLELYILRKIKLPVYLGSMALFSFFGIQTYSRTFFLMFVLVLTITIYLLFRERKYVAACILSAGVLLVGGFAITGKISTFKVILDRFSSSKTLDALTTGRSGIFAVYWEHSMETPWTALWGEGLSAGLLGNKGTHNLYMEILYYVGFMGLFLYGMYMTALVLKIKRKWKIQYSFKFRILGLMPLVLLLGIYLSLQGMNAITSYVQFFIAMVAILLPNSCVENTGKEGIEVFHAQGKSYHTQEIKGEV